MVRGNEILCAKEDMSYFARGSDISLYDPHPAPWIFPLDLWCYITTKEIGASGTDPKPELAASSKPRRHGEDAVMVAHWLSSDW